MRLCPDRCPSVPRIPLLIATLWCITQPSVALGFGKNKVHYEQLDWQYYTSEHYHVYFHQNLGDLPQVVAGWSDDIYKELHNAFGFSHRKPVPIILYGSANLFEQTNVLPYIIPEGVGGFTEVFKNRVVVPWTGSYGELRHVLHHELVHAFQFGVLYDRIGGSFLRNAGLQMPLWFAEGLAEYLSCGWDAEADMLLMDKMVHDEVAVPGPELNGYMAYKGGQSFFHFLAAAEGDSLFNRFLQTFRRLRTPDQAIEKTYKLSIEELGREWQQQLKRIYWPEIAARTDPEHIATNLTKKEFRRARYNLRPRIAPDGSKIAFFSDVRDYTRIYVVDRTGKVLTRLSQRGYGGYFESFHPFRTGVCWSPDGTQLAFVTKRAGKDELRIVDIESRDLVTTIRPGSPHTLSAPDWSPDGKRLVFVGMDKGLSDLYLYELADSSLSRLTRDTRFENSPRFLPDGSGIVFSMEDTGTYPSKLPKGAARTQYDLALLRFEDNAVTKLCSTPWDEREPSFTSDDSSIAFISNRNGIDNIYRARLDSVEHGTALTDIIGSCSSPDCAKETGDLVFTLFRKGKWHVYLGTQHDSTGLDTVLKPTRWAQYLADTSQHLFTPIVRRKYRTASTDTTSHADSASEDTTSKGTIHEDTTIEGSITEDTTAAKAPDADSTAAHVARGDDRLGGSGSDSLVSDTSVSTDTNAAANSADTTADTLVSADSSSSNTPSFKGPNRYRLRFSPDIVTFGLGVNSVYGYAGEWLVILSDLMGDHRITFAGDVQGRLDEYVHLYGAYVNSKRRLVFGLAGFYGRHYTLLGSLYHDTNAGGKLFLEYPFSIWSRLEMNCYYSHVERVAQWSNGRSRSLNILLPTLSYVFDNVIWGLTGPVNGMRAKASISAIPPIESLATSFVSGHADIRRYFHFGRKFVLALRTSFGATHSFDNDSLARRFILGGTGYWLNYRITPGGYNEYITSNFYSNMIVPFRGWYYYELSGSRFAVANVEFRFPFVREVSVAWPLPIRIRYINGAVFADFGNAWDPEDEYESIPLPHKLYGGFGFGMRVNLGFLVLRYDRAWRTDWRYFVNRPTNYWSLGGEF